MSSADTEAVTRIAGGANDIFAADAAGGKNRVVKADIGYANIHSIHNVAGSTRALA